MAESLPWFLATHSLFWFEQILRKFPWYAPARLSFHWQDQSCYVTQSFVVWTVAWLTDQLVSLVCVHVWLEDFLVALNHTQSEDQFEYVSCASGSLDWNWGAWLQNCHIATEEILGLEMSVLWKEWTTTLFLRPHWPVLGIQPPLWIVQLLFVFWMSTKWD
jgi:hypothetical protein